MRKYRIKQVGNKFHVQYRQFLWWSDIIHECIGFHIPVDYGTLDDAKQKIDQLLADENCIIHEYP